MIRDTLIGLILLACLGLASMILGPTGVLVCSAACAIGFLAREVWDRRRREMENRRLDRIMRRNQERAGIVPIGRATRSKPPVTMDASDAREYGANVEGASLDPATNRLSFPDRPIIPTKDALFEASRGRRGA